MSIGELHVTQHGDIGGNGIARFHFHTPGEIDFTPVNAQSAAAALQAFYSTLKASYPSSITIQVESDFKILDALTGQLEGVGSISTPLPPIVGGGSSASYAGGSGGRVNWKTGQVMDGRLMRGCTFIIPLASATYASSGGLLSTTQQVLLGAGNKLVADALAADVPLVVYRRPKALQTTGGATGEVIAAAVSTTPSALRSRRS